ncbi:PREDICTED: uncharacterized protein LOC108780830 [Cyphomyrmex costatus]|uniref:uncharacterized protein LOC108780830 n=1 Tax=Cyphomyrmex costatus TaxID=456900 RepID=UPI0008521ED3|nr:PREDICTED: uncharacterized protein LOC108780830 [Cyphomyrmex costatus]
MSPTLCRQSGRKKRIYSFPQSCINESQKKLICTGVPTYAELVVYSKDTVDASDNVQEENMDLTVDVSDNIQEENMDLTVDALDNVQEENMDLTEGNGREVEDSNSSIVDMLLARLKEVEEENTKLKVRLRQKCIAMDCMKKDIQKYKNFATNILCKVFTPGQVKKIMSPINRRSLKHIVMLYKEIRLGNL